MNFTEMTMESYFRMVIPLLGQKRLRRKESKVFICGYCIQCDSAKVIITREFNSPIHNWHCHILDNNEVKSFKPICGECGTRLILDFFEKPCPKCGNMFHGLVIAAFP